MNDILIRPAPGFDEPVEMLGACHGRIAAQLDTMRRLAGWLPENGADEEARQAARAILRYFDSAAVHHHEDEERDVFPRLLARVGAAECHLVEGLIRNLLSDHRDIAIAWGRIRPSLVEIADGQDSPLEMSEVMALSQLYRAHIDCEDGILLDIMRRLLTREDLVQIGASMSARRTRKA